jgi:hypothetical protein
VRRARAEAAAAADQAAAETAAAASPFRAALLSPAKSPAQQRQKGSQGQTVPKAKAKLALGRR